MGVDQPDRTYTGETVSHSAPTSKSSRAQICTAKGWHEQSLDLHLVLYNHCLPITIACLPRSPSLVWILLIYHYPHRFWAQCAAAILDGFANLLLSPLQQLEAFGVGPATIDHRVPCRDANRFFASKSRSLDWPEACFSMGARPEGKRCPECHWSGDSM